MDSRAAEADSRAAEADNRAAEAARWGLRGGRDGVTHPRLGARRERPQSLEREAFRWQQQKQICNLRFNVVWQLCVLESSSGV